MESLSAARPSRLNVIALFRPFKEEKKQTRSIPENNPCVIAELISVPVLVVSGPAAGFPQELWSEAVHAAAASAGDTQARSNRACALSSGRACAHHADPQCRIHLSPDKPQSIRCIGFHRDNDLYLDFQIRKGETSLYSRPRRRNGRTEPVHPDVVHVRKVLH